MSDNKFTDDEIIHSLKVCSTDGDCSECLINPHKGNYGYCTSLAIKAALDLINRQKVKIDSLQGALERADYYGLKADEENEHLKVELDAMRGAANSYKMHYEETERKYKIAVAEREANVEGFIETLEKQRAEIEGLKTENKSLIENDVRNKYPNCVSVEKGRIYTRTLEDYDELIGDISAEAIKEFWSELKRRSTLDPRMISTISGDNLVKEMTETK